jgi:polyisoprenoid-binding protein YceI
MKNNKILLALLAGILTYTVLLHTISCTREDEVVGTIDPPNFTYGSEVISTSSGWTFNKSHSSVLWESDYLGVSALLTGRFNAFDAKAEFDEDNPENSTLSGWVVLSSVNTGEPGRDGGCLLNTFGVTVSDTAKFKTTSIAFDNLGGYIAHADLDFHGVKKDVLVQLNYTKATRFDENSGIGGAPFTIAGLTGQFEILAKTDFGIVSTSIADRVRIKVNCQFKKAG